MDLELIKQQWAVHAGDDTNNPKRETALLIMALVTEIEQLRPAPTPASDSAPAASTTATEASTATEGA